MPRLFADPHEQLRTAVEALGRYKLRTALSILGIVLGVGAVIAMMSVSDGARRDALQQVAALGLNNLVARSHATSSFGRSTTLSIADADRITALLPIATAASPLVQRYGPVRAGERSALTSVVGVRAAYAHVLDLDVRSGRFLMTTDDASGATVCVVGETLARRLFGYQQALGRVIRIGADQFRIVGILGTSVAGDGTHASFAWRDLSESAIVPLSALTRHSPSVAPSQAVDEIWLHVGRSDRVEETAHMFDRALAVLHGGRRDFDLVVPRELLEQRYRMQRTFSIVIGSVAALSLIVGGIGIMNVMLTSVLERTNEIGVRRTVGATRRDVQRQFLTEAVLMTVAGGIVGTGFGTSVAFAIARFAGWPTHVSPLALGLGILVSALVGIGSGLYPACKAASLEPVDALRYE